jgi:hypothetical protein
LVEVDDEHSSILVDVVGDGVSEAHGICAADSAASVSIVVADGQSGGRQVQIEGIGLDDSCVCDALHDDCLGVAVDEGRVGQAIDGEDECGAH